MSESQDHDLVFEDANRDYSLGIDFGEQAVAVTINEPMESFSHAISRDEVRSLRDALTKWLGESVPGSLHILSSSPATDESIALMERNMCPCVACLDKASLIARIRQDALQRA